MFMPNMLNVILGLGLGEIRSLFVMRFVLSTVLPNRRTYADWGINNSNAVTRGFKNLTQWPWNWSTGLKIGANRAGPRPGTSPSPPGPGWAGKRPKMHDFRSYPHPPTRKKTKHV